MNLKLLAVAGVASLFLLTPASADASCCDQAGHSHAAKPACCDMPCCTDTKAAAEPSAIEVFFAQDPKFVNYMLEQDPQWAPAPPAKQLAEVWFKNPVMVGKSILQGRYIIEHDNDRMARGEPCTHIYAYNDLKTPVVTFHCTHLERDRAHQNLVVLVSTADPSIKKLTEFQFAGETASHGYPTVR